MNTFFFLKVRSTVNFPKNICNECISTLEAISLFIGVSNYNDARQEKYLIPKEENVAIVDCGTFQEHVVKTEITTEKCEEDISIEGSEICRICSLISSLTLFEEKKAHLKQLFQSITNIDVEAETNFSNRNNICNKCINGVEKISLFIRLSFCNDTKLKNTIGRNETLETKDYSKENATDIGSSEYNYVKLESISGSNELKVDNCFNENACCYENKDLHTVVDIKEDPNSPEASVRQNYRNGLESCSETNSVETPFKCDYCEKSFSIKQSLKRHLFTHTREKLFKCDCCENSFFYKSHLQQHMRTHTGEKPFNCDICKRSFALQHSLKTHVLTHTGERKFRCGCCKKRFARKQHLKVHLLTHNRENTFKCECCKKRFAKMRYLQAHLLTHAGEKTL